MDTLQQYQSAVLGDFLSLSEAVWVQRDAE